MSGLRGEARASGRIFTRPAVQKSVENLAIDGLPSLVARDDKRCLELANCVDASRIARHLVAPATPRPALASVAQLASLAYRFLLHRPSVSLSLFAWQGGQRAPPPCPHPSTLRAVLATRGVRALEALGPRLSP